MEQEGSGGGKGGDADAKGDGESGVGVAGEDGFDGVSTVVQRIACRADAEEAAAPECGDCDGEQRRDAICAAVGGVERGRRRGVGRERTVGAGASAQVGGGEESCGCALLASNAATVDFSLLQLCYDS